MMKAKNAMNAISMTLSLAALGVSIASAYFSKQANTISQEAYRRTTGQTVPLFTVECKTPHLLVIGDRAVEPETLLVTCRNDGTEAIESVRYEIFMDHLWTGERATSQPIKPSRFVHEFNRILQPGETETFDIAPEVAAHIKTLGIPKGKETFWTACRVPFSAKIVGSTYFATAIDERNNSKITNFCTFGVTWDIRPGIKKEPLNFGVDLSPNK